MLWGFLPMFLIKHPKLFYWTLSASTTVFYWFHHQEELGGSLFIFIGDLDGSTFIVETFRAIAFFPQSQGFSPTVFFDKHPLNRLEKAINLPLTLITWLAKWP